jgi:hypothetical protein
MSMRHTINRLVASRSGAAAAEMALAVPLLLILMAGSMELGNYFLNQHIVVNAVRDGARYAARQHFSNYSACSGEPGGSVAPNTRNLVRLGSVIAPQGSPRIYWPPSSDGKHGITLEVSCVPSADGQTMTGLYSGLTGGARIVTVGATVEYQSIFGKLGFNLFESAAADLNLSASSAAPVVGI